MGNFARGQFLEKSWGSGATNSSPCRCRGHLSYLRKIKGRSKSLRTNQTVLRLSEMHQKDASRWIGLLYFELKLPRLLDFFIQFVSAACLEKVLPCTSSGLQAHPSYWFLIWDENLSLRVWKRSQSSLLLSKLHIASASVFKIWDESSSYRSVSCHMSASPCLVGALQSQSQWLGSTHWSRLNCTMHRLCTLQL